MKKKETMETAIKGQWVTKRGLSRAHFVEVFRPSAAAGEELRRITICGATSVRNVDAWRTGKRWVEGVPHCQRCEEILAKRPAGAVVVDPSAPKDPHVSTIQVSVTSEESIPVTWIPVPDVEAVIEMLKRVGPVVNDDPCRIARDTLDVTIVGLRRYIDEAKDRSAQRLEAYTWTHMDEGD